MGIYHAERHGGGAAHGAILIAAVSQPSAIGRALKQLPMDFGATPERREYGLRERRLGRGILPASCIMATFVRVGCPVQKPQDLR